MAEIVSLSRQRKLKDRAKKRAEADANAVKFGRTKAERLRDEAVRDKAARDIDSHRRDPGEFAPER